MRVRSKETMDVYVYRDVEHTSTKGGIFNIYMAESVVKIPLDNIFDIIEDYKIEEVDDNEENEDKLEASIM